MADIIDINTPGWEGVNAESPLPPPESDTAHGKIDRAIARIMDTEDGETVFEWLVGAYLHQPTWAPGYDKDYGFYREGQNTLIREMLVRAEKARNFNG